CARGYYGYDAVDYW
nr:immunoglobulin heavy chain junction region [Mus musculus]